MKDIKLPKIESPSHGWAKISYYDLKGWNITLKEFSSFSFYNPSNACVYLEEDCDAPKLKKLLTEKGLRVSWKYTYRENFVPSENPKFCYLDEVKEAV